MKKYDKRNIEVFVGDEIIVIDSFNTWRQGKIETISDDVIHFLNYETGRINKVGHLFFKVPPRP